MKSAGACDPLSSAPAGERRSSVCHLERDQLARHDPMQVSVVRVVVVLVLLTSDQSASVSCCGTGVAHLQVQLSLSSALSRDPPQLLSPPQSRRLSSASPVFLPWPSTAPPTRPRSGARASPPPSRLTGLRQPLRPRPGLSHCRGRPEGRRVPPSPLRSGPAWRPCIGLGGSASP
eukprot:768193-Hanusia_phi.AAC.2